jgi:DNA-binding transcriptional regulator YiaG
MIGQIVLSCQDTVSQDRWTRRHYSPRMVINNEEALFNEQLCARVHRLRNERGMTAQEMATVLGVPADRYRKYEYRSPLPHYLLEKFALIVGRDVEFLLTGRTNRRITHLAEMAPSAESRRKRA